jgi:hypothetical protein
MLIASSGYLVLAAVFGASGLIKLRGLRKFAGELAGYELIPRAMTRPAAAGLAVGETGCAVLLVLPWTRLAGLLVASGLIVGFLAATSTALARGQRIPCGCFGGQGELDVVGVPSLLRTGLLGVVVIMSLAGRGEPFRPAEVLVAGLLLALVFLLAELARLLPRRVAGALR